ncbi:hypothetical protein P0082_07235 [Candidatus Haliotispira prima]|uniref:Uncharacterized protein n=1 Tax=Candidatus Haliotispira prima TaxID=3034016 RepID=A0ABY8MFE9_9SPIO|nr:hypothetical protein P0082_07235 [Candidatus Haliotispira prima]
MARTAQAGYTGKETETGAYCGRLSIHVGLLCSATRCKKHAGTQEMYIIGQLPNTGFVLHTGASAINFWQGVFQV